MKISELFEQNDDKKGGQYAAAKLSTKTKQKIRDWLRTNDVKDSIDVDEMHCTILYSRKPCPDYKPAGKYDTPLVGTDGKFEIWPSRDKKENILVLVLKSPDLANRHKELMDEHDASYDFDEYKPHVSFSYDFGDRKADELDPIDFDIIFDKEYGEELS